MLFAATAASAEGAPDQLRNKSVVLTWQEYRVQKTDDGQVSKSNTSSVLTVFVSSTGRLFTRLVRRNGSGRGNETGRGPEGDEQKSGTGASNLNPKFEGQSLSIVSPMRSGARLVQANFGAGFSSCSLRVSFGREGGELPYHRAMDGRMYRIISTDVSGTRCAIRSGNAVAD